MNKKTIALTKEQYENLIRTIRDGYEGSRPNARVAAALELEANLGIRISDIVSLRLSDIVRDGSRYRLNITEQKTGKARNFTIPAELYKYIQDYCIDHEIASSAVIFPVTTRAVQKKLKQAADHLGYEGIGTHSFRKFFATQIYQKNDYNLLLVQQLLQHSSPAITQRYIGIGSKELEEALQNNLNLI